MKKIAEKKTTSCYCLKLRRATSDVTRFYDKILSECDITVSQYGLLLNISKAEKGSLRELADMAELDRSTLARNIKPLIKKEFVYDAKAEGTRDSSYQLTNSGKNVLGKAKGLWEQAQKKVETILGNNGVQELEKMLRALEEL